MQIMNHSYRVESALGFVGNPIRNVYFGVELELATIDSSSSTLLAAQTEVPQLIDESFIRLKADSSINGGFEIVTAPAGMTIHKTRWKQFFATPPKHLKVTDRCGMHVHFSKSPFTQEQLRTMHRFMTYVDHVKKIEMIAERSANRYTQYIYKHNTNEIDNPTTKYEALNLAPRATAEVRVFASTLDWRTFCKNLEFVCGLTHIGLTSWQGEWDEFTRFIHARPKTYPNLLAYMKSKGLA